MTNSKNIYSLLNCRWLYITKRFEEDDPTRSSHAKELMELGGGGITEDRNKADFCLVSDNRMKLILLISTLCFVLIHFTADKARRRLLFSDFLSMIMQSIGMSIVI